MLTWAIAWTVVQAGVPWGALVVGVVGDVLIALFVIAALASAKRKPRQPHTLDLKVGAWEKLGQGITDDSA